MCIYMYSIDVCISDQLPEVELISLLEENLPQYRLRADTITDFTNYQHQDWGVQQPALIQAHDLQLSNEQIEEVFKYFSKRHTILYVLIQFRSIDSRTVMTIESNKIPTA